MRVLIVNTSEKTGGAGVAANRLKDALNNSGVKGQMILLLLDYLTPYATNFIFFGSVGVSSGTLISAENISLRLILPMQEWTLHSSQSSKKQT